MFTINQLAKRFQLSRSTLLYYDKIDLLKPSARSDANYRLYNNNDLAQLEQILSYRAAGLSLNAINEILHSNHTPSAALLEQRLSHLNEEIHQLRQQQQQVLELLGTDSLVRQSKTITKEQWVNMLRASGMDDAAMHRWHIAFERDLPEAHSDFLQSLGISEDEIQKIKAWSQPS